MIYEMPYWLIMIRFIVYFIYRKGGDDCLKKEQTPLIDCFPECHQLLSFDLTCIDWSLVMGSLCIHIHQYSLSFLTSYSAATSQSLSIAFSSTLALLQITHPSTLALYYKVSLTHRLNDHTTTDYTYLSAMTTWSMITEFAILTFLPITQCAPTHDFLTDDRSSILVCSPIIESLPTWVLGWTSAVGGTRITSLPCLVAYRSWWDIIEQWYSNDVILTWRLSSL